MAKREDMKKIEEMCKPIVEFLKENYAPYATVVITDTHIRLTRDEFGIPVNEELTAQEVPVQEQLCGINKKVDSIQICLTIFSVTIIVMLINVLFN